jgi:hypothetical protein
MQQKVSMSTAIEACKNDLFREKNVPKTLRRAGTRPYSFLTMRKDVGVEEDERSVG